MVTQGVRGRGKRPREGDAVDAVSAGGAIVAVTTAKPQTKSKAKATETKATKRRPKLIWRTRDAENSALYNLQLDISSLQSELQGLQQFRSMLMGRALNRRDDHDGSCAKIVREYFRVFRNGYEHSPNQERNAPPLLPSSSRDCEDVASPDEFVQRVMDDGVTIGRFSGLVQMMKQWERYSALLGPMQLSFLDSEIISMSSGAGDVDQPQTLVTSKAKYHLYVSLRTIEVMFPHLLPRHDIVTRILGRRISGIGKFDFVFNNITGRIIRYEFNIDFMGSFIDLLGEPVTVASMLKDALISDECFIGDLSDFVPGRGAEIDVEKESEGVEVPTGQLDGCGDTQVKPEQEMKSTSGSWKMTISSLLTASSDDDNDAEPQREESPCFHNS